MDENAGKLDSNSNTLVEDAGPGKKSFTDVNEDSLDAAFENPLAGLSKEQLFTDVGKVCRESDLMEYLDDFKKGALVAQDPRKREGNA